MLGHLSVYFVMEQVTMKVWHFKANTFDYIFDLKANYLID